MEKAASGLLSIGVGGMLLLHVFQMSLSFGLLTRTSWSLPLKNWLNCPFVRQDVESGLSLCLLRRSLRALGLALGHSKKPSSPHANA